MVLESQDEYDSQWAGNLFHCSKDWLYAGDSARSGFASMSGIPGGGDGGLTSAERQRLKELERENRELRRSNDILRQSQAVILKRRRSSTAAWEKMMPPLDKLREQYGVGPVCSELHIAPSTYYHCQQQRHHPDKSRVPACAARRLAEERDTARIR